MVVYHTPKGIVMKAITQKQNLFKAAIVLAVAVAFIMPGAAVMTNMVTENAEVTLQQGTQPIDIESYERFTVDYNGKLAQGLIFPTPGEDYNPQITKDDQGNTVVTYTNEEDPTV